MLDGGAVIRSELLGSWHEQQGKVASRKLEKESQSIVYLPSRHEEASQVVPKSAR